MINRRDFVKTAALVGVALAVPSLAWACLNCGSRKGSPVNFYPWNDDTQPAIEACTLCQNSLDLDGGDTVILRIPGCPPSRHVEVVTFGRATTVRRARLMFLQLGAVFSYHLDAPIRVVAGDSIQFTWEPAPEL